MQDGYSIRCYCGLVFGSEKDSLNHLKYVNSTNLHICRVQSELEIFDISYLSSGGLIACRNCNYVQYIRPDRFRTVFRCLKLHDTCVANTSKSKDVHQFFLCQKLLASTVWQKATKNISLHAKNICRFCAHKDKCLVTAIKNNEHAGTWGGVNFAHKNEIDSINLTNYADLLRKYKGYEI